MSFSEMLSEIAACVALIDATSNMPTGTTVDDPLALDFDLGVCASN